MAAKKNPVSHQSTKSAAPAVSTKPVTPISPVVAVTASKAATVAPAVAAVAPTAPGRDRSAVAALIARLRDADAEIARDAAQTLGALPRDADALEALCNVVRNQEGYFHSVVRAAAAQALGRLGDRCATDALVVGMRDTMAEASEEAVKALGVLGDERALDALESAIKNMDGYFLENVRRAAAEAKARIAAQRKA